MDKWLNKTGAIENQSATARKLTKKRKYDESYLQYGFTSSLDGELPFCLKCNKTLMNSSMFPAKLKRHLETTHPELVGKPKEYFESIKTQQIHQTKQMKDFCKIPEKATLASYKISQLLCKKKKPHTEAESILAPAFAIAAGIMLGPDAEMQLKKIPLSNDSIARRIKSMSSDIDSQVMEAFSATDDPLASLWSLQIDESTDISSKAQLIAFIRFIKDYKIVNQFLFCSELVQTTKGSDVFGLVDESIKAKNMRWETCVSICTDGAPSMLGKFKGFAAHVNNINPNVMTVHCMIHREALMAKVLPENLRVVMDQVVKMVNFIKSSALRSRVFASLCDSMDSDFRTLLYHTDVRWLSKGKVLQRVCILKTELESYFDIENEKLAFDHRNELWWLRVSFLADMFEKLNTLNISLQGPSENLLTTTSKMLSFQKKLSLWKTLLIANNFETFPLTNANEKRNNIVKEIQQTLTNLELSLNRYFPSLDTEQYNWVVNPFGNSETSELSVKELEQMIDLKGDIVRKTIFSQIELSEFWISLIAEYPELSTKAIKILLPFSTSYLCELGFSVLTEIKSKKRERLLMTDAEMRVCLSTIEPRIEKLCNDAKCHESH